ncbi:hypothetical protein [Xanthomonas medicagonis]|uniref:hypothetical protein n=1 Tax=Xanthomonas medicagonis TaxID=3160841 RepID=UPI00351538F0
MNDEDMPLLIHSYSNDPAELALWELINSIAPDDPLSAHLLRRFAAIEQDWRGNLADLERRRVALQFRVDRLDARERALGDRPAALHDPEIRQHLHGAFWTLDDAEKAYPLSRGVAVIKGGAAGGKNKREPEWHARLFAYATGRIDGTGNGVRYSEHELVSICARRFPEHRRDAIRQALRKKGLISPRKKRVKLQDRLRSGCNGTHDEEQRPN